ncbi:hypothetical protein [Niallia taxi]|uniref:hypothetical protein n=1 Tax=Niallia taxi TaxID=2499688 RepID=UPI001642C5BB|nr:hypothetical protein [Niallia taxi]WOD61831.1 hypothetical protein NQZ71_13525 [Niallia taxi]
MIRDRRNIKRTAIDAFDILSLLLQFWFHILLFFDIMKHLEKMNYSFCILFY